MCICIHKVYLLKVPYCSTDDCFEMDLWRDVHFLLNLNILVLKFVLFAMLCRQTLNVIIQQVTGDGRSTDFYLLKSQSWMHQTAIFEAL